MVVVEGVAPFLQLEGKPIRSEALRLLTILCSMSSFATLIRPSLDLSFTLVRSTELRALGLHVGTQGRSFNEQVQMLEMLQSQNARTRMNVDN